MRKDNIKMYIKEIVYGNVYWVEPASNRELRLAVGDTERNSGLHKRLVIA